MTLGEQDELTPDVIIIGCGSMGGALAAGYYARVPKGHLLVVDRNVDRVRATLPPGRRVRVVATIAEVGQVRPGMTVLATKPQGMAAVLPLLAPLPAAQGLVVSVAAGVSAAVIRDTLPAARVVRAMPNTPASVGAQGRRGFGAARVSQDRTGCVAKACSAPSAWRAGYLRKRTSMPSRPCPAAGLPTCSRSWKRWRKPVPTRGLRRPWRTNLHAPP